MLRGKKLISKEIKTVRRPELGYKQDLCMYIMENFPLFILVYFLNDIEPIVSIFHF